MRETLFGIVAVVLLSGCGPSDSERSSIAAAELAGRIQAGSPPLVLDVRTRDEYARGHIPGAVNIPHEELPSRLAELPIGSSDEMVVHCQSGRRAAIAENALRENGYTNVRDLVGHWKAWQEAGLPSE
ncbi:MAG: rhodanese-like domain-containing protein [Deltaproteobacteria bacterium]|nr:rhodanese-like domain-containing protein [Deltaproteobacteria bacterium]